MAKHVGIVGAGISGLRAAAVLLERGFRVTIMEARGRIGGRIAQSDQMGPIDVDIGANWVHSTGHNPIVELAKETGTDLHLWRENTLMVDSKGDLVESEQANKALKTVWVILEKAVEHSKAESASIPATASLYDFFTAECSSMIADGTINQQEAQLVLGMSEMWGAYVGTRVERQSLRYFFLEDCIEGDDCFIPSNYKKIIAKASRPAVEGATIHFKCVVESVKSDESNSPGRVNVRTASGDIHNFDAIILTTPLGWLKRHKEAIRPLTDRISEAIDAISFGNLEKVLIEFPSSFWQPEGEDERDRVSFVHWLSPQYASETNPDAWKLECVCFSAFPKSFRRNILLFYTYGDCSRHVTSSIHGKTGDERKQILRDFFEPYYSRLPNYDGKTCEPLRFLATEWSNDEYAGYGCYSNFQVGEADAAGDVLAIRYGMPDERIYFAGEHTAPFDGLGTVAGAYNSGQHVAERIIGDLGSKPNDLN